MGDTEALDCRASKIARAREMCRDGKWKYEVWNLLTLCKRCHDAFHNAAGGAVRMAIGPFFSNTNEVREFSRERRVPRRRLTATRWTAF
jgi:hypothetical protein